MRVLITGGTGLIGSALARDLAAAGHEVVVLTRDPAKATGLAPGVAAAPWDGRTAEGWGHLASGAGAIVHLAGENIGAGRWTAARQRRIRDSRVRSGEAVLAAIRAASPRPGVLVQASAVGYYGPRGDEPVDESARPGDDFLARVCIEWEASTAEAEALGVRRPVVRTGVVLAREGGALPKMLLPFRLFAGGPVGSGRQVLSWIHLADEVGAIRFLLERAGAGGPFNLTAPEPVANREFARAAGRTLGRPAFMPAPAPALRLALGEMADMLLTGQRAVPKRLRELGYPFRFPAIEPALQDLLGKRRAA
ncbi:MAG TPA: TIGR01777 family oxidoreductase [Thermoanaerobaculia bacterium]|nr:TIGR01777 family oxidoreductase [Thermoanaerobaculia bacterium]